MLGDSASNHVILGRFELVCAGKQAGADVMKSRKGDQYRLTHAIGWSFFRLGLPRISRLVKRHLMHRKIPYAIHETFQRAGCILPRPDYIAPGVDGFLKLARVVNDESRRLAQLPHGEPD